MIGSGAVRSALPLQLCRLHCGDECISPLDRAIVMKQRYERVSSLHGFAYTVVCGHFGEIIYTINVMKQGLYTGERSK